MHHAAVVFAAAALLASSFDSVAKQPRSHGARSAFVKANPCPAAEAPRLPCPGYVIDHVIPLCAGGPDRPSNMQWQTVSDAKVKDREERRQCSRTNKGERHANGDD